MQVISLLWGILSILGMFISFIPLLGWLNWGVIPFAIAGMIISIIAIASARGGKGLAVTGATLCLIAIILGTLRLKIDCGII